MRRRSLRLRRPSGELWIALAIFVVAFLFLGRGAQVGGGEDSPAFDIDEAHKLGPDMDLGPLDAVPVGEVRRVDIGGRTFALYRLATDEVVVSDGLCTHGAAHLADGLVIDCMIECPKHNGRFDLRTGAATRKPALAPLTTHPCRIREGRVVADLSGGARGGGDTGV